MVENALKTMNVRHTFSFFFVSLVLFTNSISTAHALWTKPSRPEKVPTEFDQAILNMTNWILGFVASIAVLSIIWGGVMYLTSAGDTSQAENGKNTIKYGIMGLVICGLAYALVVVIVDTIL